MNEPKEKIAHLQALGTSINWRALLAQITERDGVDAIVVAVRIDDRWSTCWGSGEGVLNNGSLSMAALKILGDVQAEIHGAERE